ncbi:MAG TPA: YMGG-like glycine zipper-containing protein [Verrucomicrobiae bacterium]|nr:YMGG-like glycine zipper-containing protein [Verrucomicrobiae bacterium]
MSKLMIPFFAVLALGVAGCSNTEKGAVGGALGGAAIGGAVGGGEGALIGGALGAGAGALIGSQIPDDHRHHHSYGHYHGW